MTREEATVILRLYNEWRRYDGAVGKGPEMTAPTQLGIAIDTVVAAMEEAYPECKEESEDERIINQLITLVNSSGEILLIPTNKEELIAWLNKCKESLHVSETCKENADSFTDEDERIRKELVALFIEVRNREGNEGYWHDLKVADILAYLEKQKEQKHPDGCFTCDEYKKGYEAGRLNGVTAGYNKAMKEVDQKEQKPVKKEITLTNFEEILNTFLFDFANSPIEDCEPKEYIKKHSAEILKVAYMELNAQLKQDIFEAMQEGRREGYEAAKAEQKPADDKAFEEWIDGWWKEHKEKAYPQITMDEKEYKNFCRGIRNMYQQKPAEWGEDYNEENIQTRFAFYTYKDDPSTLYLSNVFVEEASRNRGFGTRILMATEKVAETIGATTISLKVKQDSPANVWYRKNGYSYVCFEDGYDWLEKNLEYLKSAKSTDWSEEDINKIRSEEYTKGFNDAAFGGKLKEWSEEDEKMLNSCISSIEEAKENRYAYKETDGDTSYDHEISWLKSLRPQPRWKPSEEQMDALAYAIQLLDDGLSPKAAKAGEELEHFREQLKKL